MRGRYAVRYKRCCTFYEITSGARTGVNPLDRALPARQSSLYDSPDAARSVVFP